jgi:hypothetical protein
MARYTGGDILQIVCQHTLGEFRYAAKSNEDFTIDEGGIRVNDDANQTTGNGQAIYQKNRVRPMIEGPIAIDLATGYEQNSLSRMAEHPDEGIWTISHISGVTWKMKGVPVGDLQPSTNTAQMTLKVAGSGKLERL